MSVYCFARNDEVYMVDVDSILNTCVYVETVAKRGTDGSQYRSRPRSGGLRPAG